MIPALLALVISIAGGPMWNPPLVGGVTDPGRAATLVRVGLHRALTSRLDLTVSAVPVEMAFGQAQHGARSIYGAGVDPLGLSLRLGRAYVAASGGVRWFTAPVPIPQGQRFNFAADLEAGLQLGALGLGLDLHHVSNGGLGERNPGVNYLLMTLQVRP